jgi:hypothetical protein
MNDLETRIRRVLEEDAARAPRVAHAPEHMRARVGRRQIRNGLTATITVVAVVAGTFAGLRLLSPAPSKVPADSNTRPIYERTATIEGITVTSPSDWYLVDEWPGATRVLQQERSTSSVVLPVLQISSFDPGVRTRLCEGDGAAAPLPAHGLAIAIGLIVDDSQGSATEPCGEGNYTYATIVRGGQPFTYFMWSSDDAGAGDVASVRDQVLASLSGSMTALTAPTDLPGLAFRARTHPDTCSGVGRTMTGRRSRSRRDLTIRTST